MQIREIIALCCIGTVLFASCKKTTPRHEQKPDTAPEVTASPEDPKTNTPKTDPPAPEPPKPEPPKNNSPVPEAPKPEPPKTNPPAPEAPKPVPPKNDPPTPAPPKVDPPKSDEPKLEVLQPGVVRITNLAPGELASTFHKNNFNDADRKKVTKLIIQSGGLSQADLTYIRYHFLVKELDLTTASLSITDTDEGFYNNSTITKLILPANLTKVTAKWLSNTMTSEFIFPGNKLRIFGGAPYNDKLRHLVLPNSVEELGEDAFTLCGLERITLSMTLKRIAPKVFKWCNHLTSLTIPASVTEIGHQAFAQCAHLKSITFLGEAPKFPTNGQGQHAFSGYDFSTNKPTITVPKGSKDRYLKALGWSASSPEAQYFVEAR